jgi:hypothetical protein
MKHLLLASSTFLSVNAFGAESFMGIKFGTNIEQVRKVTKCKLAKEMEVKEEHKDIYNYGCDWKNNPLRAKYIRFDFHKGKLVSATAVFDQMIAEFMEDFTDKYGGMWEPSSQSIEKFGNNEIDELVYGFDNKTILLRYIREEKGKNKYVTILQISSNDYPKVMGWVR